MDIEKLKQNFDILKKYRVYCSLAIHTLETSDITISLFDNTKEGNIFNFCRDALYLKCIVEIRKILEPSHKDKTANLDYIIKNIYNNKEVFAQKHYDDWMIDTNSTDSFKRLKEKKALEDREECIRQIDNLEKKRKKLYNLLEKDKAFAFIRKNRNELVHSFGKTKITYYPTRNIKRIFNIVTSFIEKLDYIIENSHYNHKELDEQINEIALKFWQK